MTTCKVCGRELKGNEKFCPGCGTKLAYASLDEAVAAFEEQNQAIGVTTSENSQQDTCTLVEPMENSNVETIERRNVYSITSPSLLVEEIEKADATLVEAEPYENDIYACQKQLQSIQTQGTILRVIIVILGVILLGSGVENSFLEIFFTIIVLAVVCPILYKKWKSEPVYERIRQDQNRIRMVINASTSCIPARYIYANGINYMRELLAAGRARNLAEAIDKLEEQEHRWDIEAKNNAILQEQQRQTNQLRSINIAAWSNYWRR